MLFLPKYLVNFFYHCPRHGPPTRDLSSRVSGLVISHRSLLPPSWHCTITSHCLISYLTQPCLQDAIEFAEKAENELNRKEAEARETLNKVREANAEAMNANEAAKRALDVTKKAKDEAVGARTALDDLIEKVRGVFVMYGQG